MHVRPRHPPGRADEAELLPIAIAADLMTPRFESLAPDESLYGALAVFERSGAEALPVVGEDRELLGVLARAWLGLGLRLGSGLGSGLEVRVRG